jgi:DNA helicase-2/ATP-dependent DNA helicase PcrA
LIIGTADIVNKRGGGPSDFLFEMFGEDLKGAADLTKAHIEKVLSRGSLIREERKRYSYSDLAYYIQCPIRYRFVAIYGFEAPWLDPVGFGANVHRALEAIHQRAIDGQPTDKEDIVEIVNDVWISGRNVNEEADRKVRRAAVEQIQRYLQEYRETFDRVIRSEEYFAFPLEDRVLTGKFDLLRKVSDKEGVEVVDFKTTGFVDLDTFGINLQLDIYAMGVEQDLQHKVDKRTVHFLRDGEVHSKDWATEHEKPAKDRMNLILNRIVEEDFSPNAAYCKHCDEFNQICPYSVIIRKDEDET